MEVVITGASTNLLISLIQVQPWAFLPPVLFVAAVLATARRSGLLRREPDAGARWTRLFAGASLLVYLGATVAGSFVDRPLVVLIVSSFFLWGTCVLLTWPALREQPAFYEIAVGVAALLAGIAVLLMAIALLLFGLAALLRGNTVTGVRWNTVMGVAVLLMTITFLLFGLAALLMGVAAQRRSVPLLQVAVLLMAITFLLFGLAAPRGGDTLQGAAFLLLGTAFLLLGAADLLTTHSSRIPPSLERLKSWLQQRS